MSYPSFPVTDAFAAAVGAFAAVLIEHWLERRAAERKTMSAEEQKRFARDA